MVFEQKYIHVFAFIYIVYLCFAITTYLTLRITRKPCGCRHRIQRSLTPGLPQFDACINLCNLFVYWLDSVLLGGIAHFEPEINVVSRWRRAHLSGTSSPGWRWRGNSFLLWNTLLLVNETNKVEDKVGPSSGIVLSPICRRYRSTKSACGDSYKLILLIPWLLVVLLQKGIEQPMHYVRNYPLPA